MRAGPLRFCGCDSSAYFWPLMNVRDVAVEAGVLGLADLVEGVAEVAQDVELVEQDGGLGCVAGGRVAKRLPHVHDRQADLAGLLFPDKSVEPVHARLGAILAAEPDRPMPFQIADHDAVGVSLADRQLVDADHLRSRRTGTRELCAHVLLVEFLDGVPVEREFGGQILDRLRPAAPTDVGREPPGVERVAGQPIEPFALHGAAAATVKAANVELQVDPERTAREVPDPPFPAVVPAALHSTATPAGRFFDRRRSTMTRACGSPNTPRAVGSGRNPGNAYPSHRRRRLVDLAIRS